MKNEKIDIELITNKKVILVLNCIAILSFCFFFFLGKILTYIISILISISLIILYLDFYILFIRLVKINFKWEKLKTISNSITIGLVFLLLFDILHVFTTDWAYTIKFFKGLGPLIMLLAVIILSITTWTSIKMKSKGEKSNR